MIECYSLITILSIIVGGVASLALWYWSVKTTKRLENKSRSRVTKTKDIMKQREIMLLEINHQKVFARAFQKK